MSQSNVVNAESEEVKKVVGSTGSGGSGPSNLSLESLILLINTERLKRIHEQTHSEFTELKKRQSQVSYLHKLMQTINKLTTTEGNFDCSANEELKKSLTEAKNMGVDLHDDKHTYNKEERDRLVENIRMTVEDFNVQNEMQLQSVNRLTNERYESYQLARSIMKPLHESKIEHTKGMK